MSKPAAIPLPPFPSILADQREKKPFTFANITPDASLALSTGGPGITTAHLPTGDYSLTGFHHVIAIERKSHADLFGTVGKGRARFERELARLAALRHPFVVIESDWATIATTAPARSQMSPKAVYRSIVAWLVRYPNISWLPCGNRRLAEITTLRILERFWKELHCATAIPDTKRRPSIRVPGVEQDAGTGDGTADATTADLPPTPADGTGPLGTDHDI